MTDFDDRKRRVKEALRDPREVCRRLGLLQRSKPQPRGGLFILCPWHEEKSPSCSVRVGPDGYLQVCCFGCNAGGDVITLIATLRGLDTRSQFKDVLAEGESLAGLSVVESPKGKAAGAKVLTNRVVPIAPPPPPKPAVSDDDFDSIGSALLALCPIDRDDEVKAYLEKRRLLDEARALRWGALPPPHLQRKVIEQLLEVASADLLVDAGFIYRDDKEQTHTGAFVYRNNRLLIPYYVPGEAGLLATIQRRLLRAPTEKESKYVFPRDRKARQPYGLAEALEQMGPETAVVFCEGATDLAALRVLFRRHQADCVPLGVPGVNNWMPDWAKYAAGRVALVAFDQEKPSSKAAKPVKEVVTKIIADLTQAGALEVRLAQPAGGKKDWAEILETADAEAAHGG